MSATATTLVPAGETEAYIRVLSETVNDIESSRIAMSNRLSTLDPDIDAYGYLAGLLEGTKGVEADAVKHLERAVKSHPLYPWLQTRRGVGLKSFARLLGSLTSGEGLTVEGEEVPPSGITFYYAAFEGEPVRRIDRTVLKLWAYCGFAPEQRKRKGQQAKWNHQAKSRLFVIADSAIKHRCDACRRQAKDSEEMGWLPPAPGCSCREDGFVERANYDTAQMHWIETRPDVKKAHRHTHALRIVAKSFLKDMYNEAKTYE